MEGHTAVPNRLLKDGIRTSDSINLLTPEEEVFFYRLLVVADDFGHMDGRLPILKSECFPLKDSLQAGTISKWLSGLAAKGLVGIYEVAGKPFVAILKWEARVRTNPKYPQPSADDLQKFAAHCAQPADRRQTGDRVGKGLGMGLGMGLGKGASDGNSVAFSAEQGTWAIPEILREKWQKAFPAVDIDGELQRASVWLMTNPKNQKSNYGRFLSSWLDRAQNKAPRAANDGHRAQGGFDI